MFSKCDTSDYIHTTKNESNEGTQCEFRKLRPVRRRRAGLLFTAESRLSREVEFEFYLLLTALKYMACQSIRQQLDSADRQFLLGAGRLCMFSARFKAAPSDS